ncbi:hypothetical protein LJR030_003614 [Rhizobium sp. LjRoot30]|uniref:hypothetical protein n=1 Tax=Rhizobium sp. LjRoot30 TaxID=3342320 RepID=UPI003ECF6CB9
MTKKLEAFAPIGALAAALLAFSSFSATAQEEEEYKPQIPEASIYQAMLDANKQTGWIAFRQFMDQQLIYFTTLQTMHCRLSEIRYSINSETLDQRFPVAKCDPQLPFNLPDDPTNETLYLKLKPNEAKTIAVQVVWDDGNGSEIVVYKPCQNAEATCAQIKTILKPTKMRGEPAPATPTR